MSCTLQNHSIQMNRTESEISLDFLGMDLLYGNEDDVSVDGHEAETLETSSDVGLVCQICFTSSINGHYYCKADSERSHAVCGDCMKSWIATQIASALVPVRCPLTFFLLRPRADCN
eukprot:Rmarinus@m.3909